jgi:2,6-dihydroxypseudooxynicotine hydrolase
MNFKRRLLQQPWALEWMLRIWGGKRILKDYFLSRSLSIGVPLADILDAFNKIRSMTHWVKSWYSLGIRRQSLAEEAEKDEMSRSATALWMMARAAFHMAQFPFFGNPTLKQKIYQRCANAYLKAAPHLDPPARRIEIPFRHTHLPGYLRVASAGSPEICIVILAGIDGVKEETHYYGEYFVQRGFSVLYFDAPCLGESWERVRMDPYFQGIGRAVFNFLNDDKEFHFSKIGLLGLSLGGNMAVHIAASDVPVQSCVAVSAPFEPKNYFRDLFFLVQQAAHHVIDESAPLDRFMEMISLKDISQRVRCPLLLIGGDKDNILPGKDILKIYEIAPEPKKLIFYPDGTHCCPEHSVEMLLEIERWFRKMC